MRDSEEIIQAVQEHLDLIAVTSQGLAESKERAAKFLLIQAVLIEYLRQVDEELVKMSTLKEATYAQRIGKTPGKNITEKKINVAMDEEYSPVRESYGEWDALREWVKGHIKIFENAHILYRGFSREER